jgi:hypothetical protein
MDDTNTFMKPMTSRLKRFPKIIYVRNPQDDIKKMVSEGKDRYESSHKYIYGTMN